MQPWQRIKYGLEWGFFFGVVSWLLSTGISSHIPTWGVWGIIISRTLMGFLSGAFILNYAWALRGILIAAAVNIPFGIIAVLLGTGWTRGFWPFLISGLLIGVLMEWIMKRNDEKINAKPGEET